MNDDEERLESLSARLKERQMAEKFKIQDIENKLEQAEAMTLRLLDSSHGETDSIEEVRVIAEPASLYLQSAFRFWESMT